MSGDWPFLVFVLCLPLWLLAAAAIQGASYRGAACRLRAFSRRLESPALRLDQGWFPSLEHTSLRGRYDGRPIRVGFRVTGSGKHKTTWLRCELKVDNPTASFQVSQATLLRRFGRWLGVVRDRAIGQGRVDDKFVLKGGRRDLSRLFQCGRMERALDALFNGDFGVDQVTMRSAGQLTIETRYAASLVEPRRLDRLCQALARIADLCERREVRVAVLGERRQFAWTGGGQTALCPYCRDEVQVDAAHSQEDLGLCSECGTVHHAECLEEAGGCTVFGCVGGRRGVRAGRGVRG